MDGELQWQDSQIKQLREAPISFLRHTQPHGILLVLQEPGLVILQISSNTLNILGIAPENMLFHKLEEFLLPDQITGIKVSLSHTHLDFINPTKICIQQNNGNYLVFDAIFHRNTAGVLILELEPITTQTSISFFSFYNLVSTSINRLKLINSFPKLCKIITNEVRKITGFDRVLLYKFTHDNHGCVIAESKLPSLDSYLNIHYPESDIPQPIRELFLANPIRLIADTNSESVQILPVIHSINEPPLDLTNSSLRNASTCHLKYLQNMGVRTSLTISLINQERLWGLIACHHQSPKYISYEMRKICELLGRGIFSEISTREQIEDYDYSLKVLRIQSLLVEHMSGYDNFIDALVKYQSSFLDLTNAQGGCVYFNRHYTVMGETPEVEDIQLLVAWLNNHLDDDIFYTDSLAKIYPDGEKIKHVASGVLAIVIGKDNYVFWFRPEVVKTVNWSGNPHQPFEISKLQGDELLLSPRKSFKLWQEAVISTSLPWKDAEIKAASELQKGILNVILRQTDKLVKLTRNLERSNAELKKFAYVTSHDLQAPLNQVANYVQLLAMRYESELDEDAKEFIHYAVDGVCLMQNLIDDVLAYSKVDSQAITFEPTPVENCLEIALNNLRQQIIEVGATITHPALPTVIADHTQLVQLFLNLISNSLKFRSQEPLKIHIGVEKLEDEWLFSIRDNGIGIDPEFRCRIFVIFQRLHTREEYPGTGVGLAICQKIIQRHQGRIWIDSQLGQGATFYFTIPI